METSTDEGDEVTHDIGDLIEGTEYRAVELLVKKLTEIAEGTYGIVGIQDETSEHVRGALKVMIS